MPPAAMAPDAQGCTVLGTWVKRRMEQSAGVAPGTQRAQHAWRPAPTGPICGGQPWDPAGEWLAAAAAVAAAVAAEAQ